MIDLTQTCVRWTPCPVQGPRIGHDNKIQHIHCENIHKPREMQSANIIYAANRQRLRLRRFTYGNHAATLVQNLSVSILTASSTVHSKGKSDATRRPQGGTRRFAGFQHR
jgi:hypothetical protein